MRNLTLLPLLGALAGGPAFAQDASLQRCRSVSEPAARLACYDGLADAAARPQAPAASAAAQPTSPATAAAADAGFGLAERRRAETADWVRSSVGASFAGWGPNSRIRLDNGQVWQVVDGSSVSLPQGGRNVVVRRGLFGNYQLEIEGLNTSPKVRRLE